MDSKDKDYRLITLVTDICPILLRRYFLDLAKYDGSPGVPFSTLDHYMAFRNHDVQNLKSLRRDQYDLIYPKAEMDKWDVTLLSALLLGFFKGLMKNGENHLIDIIRENRNKLQHKPGNLVTDDAEFDSLWNDIDTATLTLASFVGGKTYEDEIKAKIESVRTNNLPRLGDTLRSWYEDIIIQLKNEIEELKESSKKSLGILEASHVKRKLPTDGKSKRMKIVDVRVDKLRDNFRQTVEREGTGESPLEELEIQRRLKNQHSVVVTGSLNTSYKAIALMAITNSENYFMDRCCEIKTPEDWTSVDPMQTDLVLFCEPFEDESFTEKRLHDTFESMLYSSKESCRESRIDVVIVSEQSKVKSWKEHDGNELFNDVVELFRPTDESNPLDLEKPQTEILIENCKTDKLDRKLKEKVQQMFRTHKSIVITGPKGGKSTSFALNLVSSLYSKNQCVVLTDANDWKQVSLGKVSVIIIDEFAGKYKYNSSFVESWLNKFDMIYAAVVTGKLNVIVTCESSFFKKVLKNFAGHDLLEHRVKLPGASITYSRVKEEPLSPIADNLSSPPDSDDSLHEPIETTREVVKRKPHCDVFVSLEKHDGYYKDFCEMPDGTIICTYSKYVNERSSLSETGIQEEKNVSKRNWFLAIFNPETFQTTEFKELAFEPHDLSAVQGNMEVIFRDKDKYKSIQSATLVDSVIQLGEIEEKSGIYYETIKVAKIHLDRYISCSKTSITFFDLEWKDIKHIETDDRDKPLFYESFSRSTSPVSKKKNITDLTLGNNNFFVSSLEKVYIFDLHGVVQKSLFVPSMSTYIFDKESVITFDGRDKHAQFVDTNDTNNEDKWYIHVSKTTTDIFYAEKNRRLFVANYNTWSTCVVKN